MSATTLSHDRHWFETHPNAIVRFRRQRDEEFSALSTQGHQAPVFRPSFAGQEALTWVAVVDLLQLLQDPAATTDGTRMRLRMRTIPIRGAQARAQARDELIQAVARELLDQALMDEALHAGEVAA